MKFYPLTFDYAGMFRSYLWGGQRLAKLVNAPANEPVAELWAVSDRPEEGIESTVANGEYAGQTLVSLMRQYPTELLGFTPANNRFPILIKIIDAQQPLSIQVHPPKAVAEQFHGTPKAEAWFVLPGTQPSAELFAGLAPQVTHDQFQVALAKGEVEPLLHKLPAAVGTMLNIPNGRVHGIGAGNLILEVQENSNTTYRVFDYNRVDAKTGQPRELHIDQALASINFADHEPQPELPVPLADEQGTRVQLLATEHFSLEHMTASTTVRDHTHGLATIVANTSSTPTTVTANGVAAELPEYGMALVPAGIDEFTVTGNALDYVLIRPSKA